MGWRRVSKQTGESDDATRRHVFDPIRTREGELDVLRSVDAYDRHLKRTSLIMLLMPTHRRFLVEAYRETLEYLATLPEDEGG